MVIRIEDLKDVCSIILSAVDSSDISKLNDTLELKTENNILYLNVTNKEYFAQVKLNMDEKISFHATVNASLFLNLVSKTTSNTVELKVKNNFLEFKGNGNYKIPLIYDGESLLELPKIEISNVSSSFDIETSILHSIMKYNSKELVKGVVSRPVQNLYYVDDKGCITFTSGACVNNFTLKSPIKILLSNRVVKLFKLFKKDKINFTVGHQNTSGGVIQTRVKFEDDKISVYAILPGDDSLISSVPVSAIRGRANKIYDYSVTFNRVALSDALNRLLLFNSKQPNAFRKFVFNKESVIISDLDEINKEEVDYINSLNIGDSYRAVFDILELKTVLDGYKDEYIIFKFGDHQAAVLAKNNILNVIPECE